MNSRLSYDDRILRDRAIEKAYRDGLTTREIAKVHSLTPGRVVQILNASGVHMRRRGCRGFGVKP